MTIQRHGMPDEPSDPSRRTNPDMAFWHERPEVVDAILQQLFPGQTTPYSADSEHLHLVFEYIPAMVFVCDAQGACLYTNQRFANYTGKAVEQARGTGWRELLHPDDAAYYARLEQEFWTRAAQASDLTVPPMFDPEEWPYRQEYRMRMANGSYRWFMLRSHPFYNDTNTLLGWVGVCIDIDEMKQAQMALYESEERFRMVLKDSPTMVVAQDRDLRYTWVYNAPQPLPAQPETTAIGKTDYDLLPPDEAEAMIQIKRAVLESGEPQRAKVKVTAYGQPYWYDIKIEAIRNRSGDIVGVTSVATDVTSYHYAEMRQRLIADVSLHMADPTLDIHGRLHALTELLVRELADYCMLMTPLLAPDVQPSMVMTHRDATRNTYLRKRSLHFRGTVTEHHPLEQAQQSGQCIYLRTVTEADFARWTHDAEHQAFLRELAIQSLIVVPIPCAEGSDGVLSVSRSTLEQPYDQDDVFLIEEIGRRIGLALDNALLYEAEQRARAEAEAAVAIRDKVFHLVSHDLKSPLGAIHGYTQLLKQRAEKLDTADAERWRRGLAMIDEATQRMTSQIQELLDVAALQGGQQISLEPTTVDAGALLTRAAAWHQQTSPRHTITVHQPPELVILRADSVRLERVIDNLIDNAIKYSPTGGAITVVLTTTERADPPGAWACISIRDEGIGIVPDAIPHLFEPFWRAQDARAQVAGTGLGLASAHQIITLHGGTIQVASEVDVGTTFTIWLPLAATDDSTAALVEPVDDEPPSTG